MGGLSVTMLLEHTLKSLRPTGYELSLVFLELSPVFLQACPSAHHWGCNGRSEPCRCTLATSIAVVSSKANVFNLYLQIPCKTFVRALAACIRSVATGLTFQWNGEN